MSKNNTIVAPKMRPISMRWGYDGGGMACGPVEGSTVTEITFLDEDGRLVFVSATRLMEFVNMYVSNVPLYDLLIQLAVCEDADYEIALMSKTAKEEHSLEVPNIQAINGSEYCGELYLTLVANDHFELGYGEEEAEDWIYEYNNGEPLEWKSEDFLPDEDEDEEDDD